MRVIVDANIVFSGILNSNGKIGDLLINSEKQFDFIAPNFLRSEIYKHYQRLCKISGLKMEQIREAELPRRNLLLILTRKTFTILPTQNILDVKFGVATKNSYKDLQRKDLQNL